MNNLVTSSYYDLAPTTKASAEGIVSSVLSALPMAITRPLLEYRRLNAQVDVIMRAIEANEKTREDIMKTIRELGAAGQLTPELAQYLFAKHISVPGTASQNCCVRCFLDFVSDNVIDAMSRVISAVQMDDPPLCFSAQHLQNPAWVCVSHGFRRRCLLQEQIVIGGGDKVSRTVDL